MNNLKSRNETYRKSHSIVTPSSVLIFREGTPIEICKRKGCAAT